MSRRQKWIGCVGISTASRPRSTSLVTMRSPSRTSTRPAMDNGRSSHVDIISAAVALHIQAKIFFCRRTFRLWLQLEHRGIAVAGHNAEGALSAGGHSEGNQRAQVTRHVIFSAGNKLPRVALLQGARSPFPPAASPLPPPRERRWARPVSKFQKSLHIRCIHDRFSFPCSAVRHRALPRPGEFFPDSDRSARPRPRAKRRECGPPARQRARTLGGQLLPGLQAQAGNLLRRAYPRGAGACFPC